MKEKKNKLFVEILILFILQLIMISGLWAIDIGISALIIGGETQGLLGIRSANVQYHLGLIVSFFSFFFLALWMLIKLIIENKEV